METIIKRQKLNRIKVELTEIVQTDKWLAEQLGEDPVAASKWCTKTSQSYLYPPSEISNLLNIDNMELIVSSLKNDALLNKCVYLYST